MRTRTRVEHGFVNAHIRGAPKTETWGGGRRPAPQWTNTIMPRVKFNKLIAFVVLAGFAAWMGTGKFSSVGSAATEDAAKPAPTEEPKATVRTVAVGTP